MCVCDPNQRTPFCGKCDWVRPIEFTIDKGSAALLCYVAIREQAERTVEQWDNHDQFRETEADKALNDPRIGEPSDVAIARHFLQLLEASEQASGSGFQSHAANGVVESAVKCYRGDFAT